MAVWGRKSDGNCQNWPPPPEGVRGRQERPGCKVLTDGEAVPIDAESGAPAFLEALLLVAGVRHGSRLLRGPSLSRCPASTALSPQTGAGCELLAGCRHLDLGANNEGSRWSLCAPATAPSPTGCSCCDGRGLARLRTAVGWPGCRAPSRFALWRLGEAGGPRGNGGD
ncbi:hypothetical protein NN561_010380 [Cricetulus griseus]